MAAPTRGQWRGLALLSLLLALLLMLLILRPRSHRAAPSEGHERLEALLEQYGDSMERSIEREEEAFRQRYPRPAYDTFRRRQEAPQRAPRRPVGNLELNSADTAALRQLYGIGPVFAARIVKYRNLLGGYVRKEQLLEVYGMTPERYDGIAESVTVDASQVERLEVNKADISQLRRHPYLDYYQAKALVDYRQKGHTFHSAADLLKVNLIDEATVEKLEGYLLF